MAGPIIVIGSINMDLVCRAPRMPQSGETILGSDFVINPGGKGANQAVAAARLARRGVKTHLIGRIGEDDFGRHLLHGLRANNVDVSHVKRTPAAASGVAMILVDRKGENSIVVAPGANAKLSPQDIDEARGLIRGASAVLLQLEIPHETVAHAIGVCRDYGVHTILDPAPAPARLPRRLMNVDVFTPNQREAQTLLDLPEELGSRQVGVELLSRGPGSVVLKLGRRGSMMIGRDGTMLRSRGFRVDVVDSTAAGDAFNAALAVAHAEGMEPVRALRFANAAGALCCTTLGAQPALPTRTQVDKLIAAHS